MSRRREYSNYTYEQRSYFRKKSREKELRRYCILFAVAVILVLALSLSFHAVFTSASTSTDNVSFKYYTRIEIEAGDTLWSIAEEYADSEHYSTTEKYINEVKHINDLDGDDIISGNHLVIPYYSEEFVSSKM